jgi:MFS transporter, DHA1 family, multidrug resistance protein
LPQSSVSTALVMTLVALSSINYFMVSPLLVLDVARLDKAQSALWSGIVVAASPIVAGVVGPFWGRLTDRFGPRPMLLRSGIGVCLSTAALPFASTPWLLVICRLANGASAGFLPAAMTLGVRDTAHSRLGNALTNVTVARNVGSLAGPAIGASVAAVVGFPAAFEVGAGLMACATLAVIVFVPARAAPRAAGTAADIGDSRGEQAPAQKPARMRPWRAVLADAPTRTISALVLTSVLASSALVVAVPYLLLRQSHGRLSQATLLTGLVLTIGAVVALVSAKPWGYLADRFGVVRPLLMSLAGTSAALVAIWALAADRPGFVAAYVVYAVFQSEVATLFLITLMGVRASLGRGTVVGINQGLSQFGLAGGAFAGGVLVTGTGAGTTFLLSAAVYAACALVVLMMARNWLRWPEKERIGELVDRAS